MPESTIDLPLLCASMLSPGNSRLICSLRRARSRCTMISYWRRAPLRSQTNIEMVPGNLPLMSSWFADVTIASATSALVSDTREIGVPTSTTVERPTSRRTGGRSSPAKTTPGVATAIRRMSSDEAIRSLVRMLLLLPHDFVGTFVSADDFYRLHLERRHRDGCHRRTTRCGARTGDRSPDRRAVAEQRRGPDALRERRRLVERVAKRELDLAFGAGQRQPL